MVMQNMRTRKFASDERTFMFAKTKNKNARISVLKIKYATARSDMKGDGRAEVQNKFVLDDGGQNFSEFPYFT